MNWYFKVLLDYAVFSGRARRKEYWYFFLFNLIIIMLLTSVDNVTLLFSQTYAVGLFSSIYSLAVFIPSLAVLVRRLHDTGRSAWWLLLALIPIIGSIVLLIFAALDSEPGPNEYGPNPK